MEGSYHQHSQDGHPAAPGMYGHGDYPSPGQQEIDGKAGTNFILIIGMYEGDPYGDEIDEGDEDKNDGLNALVRKEN